MFLSNASAARPVAVSCLIIALALLGANAYRTMSLELTPKMDIPWATVVTTWPGATPEDLESDVAKRVEDAVATVDGLKHVVSILMDNVCQTTLEFHIETDIDIAVADVRQKIDAILNDLPSDAENPVILKVDINATPIITLAFAGELPLPLLYDYVDQQLSDRLSSIPGVANVNLIGGAEREIHVVLDRDKMAAAGISSPQVSSALQHGVLSAPSGRIRTGDGRLEYNVRYDAEYRRAVDIQDLQVVGRDGARRFIRDLGRIEEIASEEIRQASYIDGRPCIGIQVVKRGDANAVEVIAAVRREIEAFKGLLPGGTELVWVVDDGDFIEASFDTTSGSVISGMVLTAVILFLFLFNFRSALVVAVSMPLTIVISLFFMQASGFTLNVVTLQALALSVGTLVTNSIVVLESISGQLEAGKKPWEAARDGASDVAVAILASSGTNMVVLLPIGLMGEIVGMIFRPFALTTLYANLASLLISFTMTPILCGLFLKPRDAGAALTRAGDRVNDWLGAISGRVAAFLRYCGRKRWPAALVVAATAAIFVHTLSMAGRIGFAMFPEMDRGQFIVKLEYPTQQSLGRTVERVQEVEDKLRRLPGLVHLSTGIGKINAATGNPSEGTYLAAITVVLEPKGKRTIGMDAIMEQVGGLLADHTDCVITPVRQDLTGGEDIPIQMVISGEDTGELERIATTLLAELKRDPRFLSPSSNVRDPRLEVRVQPNRALLADAGIDPDWIGNYLHTNLEGVKAARYRAGGRSFDIRVKFEEKPGLRQVEEFQVPFGDGQSVALTHYAGVSEALAPVLVSRFDKSRMAMVFSSLRSDFPLSAGMARIDEIVKERDLLPPGYRSSYIGTAEMMGTSMSEFAEAAAIAVVLTYLVLSAVLESFGRSWYIMLTVPLGLIGVLWALAVTGAPIDMFVMLGCVLLIGIVVNNAVLIIDHAQQLEKDGMGAGEAMVQAVSLEFRPVLMITVAAVFGMMPLALASGLGSEMSFGIGVASVGGILVSAILTLVMIPAMFLLFNRPPESASPEEAEIVGKSRRAGVSSRRILSKR